MAITIRRAEAADAGACGEIAYRAFQTLHDHHNFPRPYPSVEVATGLLSTVLANPGFYGIVGGTRWPDRRQQFRRSALVDRRHRADYGRSRGSESGGRTQPDANGARSPQRAQLRGHQAGQAAFNNHSLSLYTTIGFRTRESLSVM